MQTDKPRFAEIGLATNATKSQIQTEIMNLDYDEDRERLGERELDDKAPALTIYPSQRTAQLFGYFNEVADFCYIPFDDLSTFRTLLRSEDLTGVYGCSPNPVLQEYLTQAKPYFEDLIPLCAASIIPRPTNHIYTSRRYGIEWKHRFAPEVEAILSETCGDILYNEQVYALASLVGYTPSEAEEFRKVLSKRKKQEYNKHRYRFSKHKGLFRKLITEGCWSLPKAWVAEFTRLVYTTAYLKTHFPEEYTRVALCVVASDLY
jgi:DNA polymerase-3 subunit alpha